MRPAAQSKAETAPIAELGVDITGRPAQVAHFGSETGRVRPPVTVRRVTGEVTIGTEIVASTQELERPFIKTIVVGDAGTVRTPFSCLKP